VRREYAFEERAAQPLVSRWLVAGWRFWRPLMPAGFRQMPQALAADRRMAQS
jgi:uncharacterized protein (DUF2236 family)